MLEPLDNFRLLTPIFFDGFVDFILLGNLSPQIFLVPVVHFCGVIESLFTYSRLCIERKSPLTVAGLSFPIFFQSGKILFRLIFYFLQPKQFLIFVPVFISTSVEGFLHFFLLFKKRSHLVINIPHLLNQVILCHVLSPGLGLDKIFPGNLPFCLSLLR